MYTYIIHRLYLITSRATSKGWPPRAIAVSCPASGHNTTTNNNNILNIINIYTWDRVKGRMLKRVWEIYGYGAWRPLLTRGWRNMVAVVLFEISNSTKPNPSVFHAYINQLRPMMGFVEPKHLDEISNRIPPTSLLRQLLEPIFGARPCNSHTRFLLKVCTT